MSHFVLETDEAVAAADAAPEARRERRVRVRALDLERSPPLPGHGVRQAIVVALLAAAASLLTIVSGSTTQHVRFIYFDIALVAAALYAGLPGGLFTLIVGVLVVAYRWLPPHGTLSLSDPASAFAVISFTAGGTMVAAIAAIARRQARELGKARDAALATEERRRLIAEASRVLSSSLDYETTVARVAELAVPTFADGCAVDLVVEGAIKRLAIAHADPERTRLLHDVQLQIQPALVNDSGAIASVIRTGEPQLIPVVSDAMLQAVARSPEQLAALRELGVRSAMIVPISTRGIILGALTLVSCRPDARFTEADFNTAQALGRRAAAAIDNARLYRAARAANEMKRNFIATMSHELRTPLTAIIGFQELLAEGVHGPVSDGQRESLDRIKGNALRLLSLVEEILLFRRLDAGTESLHVAPFRARQLVDDVVAFGSAMAEERGITLRAEADPALEVESEFSKVRQILVTFVSNALKFTSKGEVVVRAKDAGDTVVFEVQDSGVGIDEASLAHIFDPFWQVDQSKTRPTGGSGLGLTVARRLSELIDAEISVESEVGVGSTFRLRLPKSGPRVA